MIAIYRLYRFHLRRTLHLSIPIIIGQLGMVLMGVFDNVMVGRVGAAELAAAGIANAVYFLVVIFGLGTLSAISPLVAMAGANNDHEECSHLFRSSLSAGLLLSVFLALVLYPVSFFFDLFDQPAEVTVLAAEYLQILTVSTFPLMFFVAGKNFTDGLSMTKPAMYITLVGLLLNVLLNWILIYGNLGLPALGLNGAGYATLISRTVMALFIIWYIFGSGHLAVFREGQRTREIRLAFLRKILKIGVPAGMQYFFEIAAFSGAAIMAGWIGTQSLAAHNIAISLASVSYMIASGFASAGAIRVGNALGRKEVSGIYKAGTAALILSVAFMAISCAIFLIFNEDLVRLFIGEEDVVKVAASLLIIAAFFQLSDGSQATGLGILRGLTDVNIPTLITLFSYWVIGIPLGYLLAFRFDRGVSGIWIGLLVGLTLSSCLLNARFYNRVRKLRLKGA